MDGYNAVAKAAIFINGNDVTDLDGPEAQNLLTPRGPAPRLNIAHHTLAARPETRVVPITVALAAIDRDDVGLWAAITRGSDQVHWRLWNWTGPQESFCFEPAGYDEQLWHSITDRSWEIPADRTLRAVRERCDHAWLKSRGLLWRGGSVGTDDALWIYLTLFNMPPWVSEFRTPHIDHDDPEAAGQVLESLYSWVGQGLPSPRMLDWAGNPNSAAGIPRYP